jgi:hypothetical protein
LQSRFPQAQFQGIKFGFSKISVHKLTCLNLAYLVCGLEFKNLKFEKLRFLLKLPHHGAMLQWPTQLRKLPTVVQVVEERRIPPPEILKAQIKSLSKKKEKCSARGGISSHRK